MKTLKRFYLCLRHFMQGNDVGLRPNPFLIGELPIQRNRKQRRAEQKQYRQKGRV